MNTHITEIRHTINCNTLTTALLSSVLSSIVFLVFGLLCGQITRLFSYKKKKTNLKPHALGPLDDRHSPVYEVVPPIPNKQKAPREVNLHLNEAYGPV